MELIAPPHGDPHPPRRLTLPPGSCDAHCHIFGPSARFPYSPSRHYTPPDATIDDCERLQATLGLSRAVLVQASCHGTDNSVVVDATRPWARRAKAALPWPARWSVITSR